MNAVRRALENIYTAHNIGSLVTQMQAHALLLHYSFMTHTYKMVITTRATRYGLQDYLWFDGVRIEYEG